MQNRSAEEPDPAESIAHAALSETQSKGAPAGSETNAPSDRSIRRRCLWLYHALIMAALFLAAFPIRWSYARGDLWFDEARYALAAVRGFQANRWDISDVPSEPTRLLQLRHYHPPLTVHATGLMLRFSVHERILRLPHVIAGCLAVCLVYLCGLALLHPPQTGVRFGVWTAAACAFVVAWTPPQIRSSSHAIPWSFITVWILLLLLPLMLYARTRRAGWLISACVALGGMFVTSEMFFVVLLATLLTTPFLLWTDLRDPVRRRHIVRALVVGACLFLLIAYLFWPAGLLGGAVTMLRHYMAMADDSWPVTILGTTYARAPRWAYAYWYARFFEEFFLLYLVGLLTASALLLRRRVTPPTGVLLICSGVVLLAAHKAHMIGPEYLAHALPLLTLMCGLLFSTIGERSRPAGYAAMGIACLLALKGYDPHLLSGMDARSLRSRWPAAARFLAGRWKTGDMMLASQYGAVGRWYMVYYSGVASKEWQVQAIPPNDARESFLQQVASGRYRFAAIGSTVADAAAIDPRLKRMLASWQVVWRSEETDGLPSRLVIYQHPPGVSRTDPLASPPAVVASGQERGSRPKNAKEEEPE
jgi:4-amino-4-deoxy-L-arabinose transferase-like glycosyltransferase